MKKKLTFIALLLSLSVGSTALAANHASKASKSFVAAVFNRNYEIANLYLSQGADINCRSCHPYNDNSEAHTPLMLMLISSNYRPVPSARVQYLIGKGADINLRDKSCRTALMYAIQQGVNPAMNQVQADTLYLLDHGADAKALDNAKNNAFHYLAAQSRYIANTSWESRNYAIINSVAHRLSQDGANINQSNVKGETPIYIAASKCAVSAVETFYALGADPQKKTNNGESPLSIAMEKAANSPADSGCNQTVGFLNHPTLVSNVAFPVQQAGTMTAPQNSNLLQSTGQLINSGGRLINSFKTIFH